MLMNNRPSRRAIVGILVAVLLINLYLFGRDRFYTSLWIGPTETQLDISDSNSGLRNLVTSLKSGFHPPAPLSLAARQETLLRDLSVQLKEQKPQCSPPKVDGHVDGVTFDPVNLKPRPDHVANADEIQGPMQEAHDGFVAAIKEPKARPYNKGTKGIVSSAGGEYLPTFVASLRMIRRTGCELPVEVFLKDWVEYEPYICEVVLPKLDAQCKVLEEIMDVVRDGQGKPSKHIKVEHFQIKPFAMLLSSFENFIWIDADCVPLHDPTALLGSDPFSSTGLVTWPDFWANTASPLYFNISRQSEPLMTARAATESGVMLVSKRKHFPTLLLAVYYNYYGPEYYWPLLGQGAYGQGDKDTFIQAASALGTTFHTVSEPVAAVERDYDNGAWTFTAMVQADPIEDYKLTSQDIWRVTNATAAKAPRVFFLHASSPKFNAGLELAKKSRRGRLYTRPEDVIRRFGYDIEKSYWQEAMTVACDLEHAFDSWKKSSELCEDMQNHWNKTFSDPDAEFPQFSDN
ncbi:nucleotide-diphospho-sugar transferase [Penicillium sp. IBT 35674x]|nr:nucleotide-diphospho-sugar transferase [Penicillium sp. IBT 35674x]